MNLNPIEEGTFATPGGSAGILIPLFSIPSARSWGIGEITDIRHLARWQVSAGLDVLQLLPIHEVPPGQTSPYTPLTAMAIDPVYISLEALEDVDAIGGRSGLPETDRVALERACVSRSVRYQDVRRLKLVVLRRAFDHFYRSQWQTESTRARELKGFLEEQAFWIDDYALFRAIHARLADASWMNWPKQLRDRDAEILARARTELSVDILFFQYLQWVAESQWQRTRAELSAMGIRMFGDFPFMVGRDSADVWSRQGEFRLDASVGTPPDAFSETGQDWGVPVYRWEVMRQQDFSWIRARARRSAALYDAYRIDHVVGFYRTYVRPADGLPFFAPGDEQAQLQLGETVLGVIRRERSQLIAEDLGTVPDFVRHSLAKLAIPGFKVLRWERQWGAPGQPFRDPITYPRLSVAMSSTHDTTPLATWWEELSAAERRRLCEIPVLNHLASRRRFTRTVRDAVLEVLYGSGSQWVILPVQDFFGWRDRVNVPATTGIENWTYRLPWPSDSLGYERQPRQRAAALSDLGRRHHRGAFSRVDMSTVP